MTSISTQHQLITRPLLRQTQTAPNLLSNAICHSTKNPPPRHPLARAMTSQHAKTIPIPPLDPSPHDPSAVFVRWPFTQPVTWSTFVHNPNWFLDASDFNYEGAPLYPCDLEPPRGWGPPKIKRNQPHSHSESDNAEHRLRCTFCRRTYGGVNAKSMWRRHVFDKHRVAMKNRRESVPKLKVHAKENETNELQLKRNQVQWLEVQDSKPSGKRESDRSAKETISEQDQSSSTDYKLKRKASVLTPAPAPPCTPPHAPMILQGEFTPLRHGPSIFDSLGLRSSPYDPTRTPQFIHSRPSEPLERALRHVEATFTITELTLSPSKVFRTRSGPNLLSSSPSASVEKPHPTIRYRSSAMPSDFLPFHQEESDAELSGVSFSFADGDDLVNSSQITSSTSFSSGDLGDPDGSDNAAQDYDGILGEFFNWKDLQSPSKPTLFDSEGSAPAFAGLGLVFADTSASHEYSEEQTISVQDRMSHSAPASPCLKRRKLAV